jgi:hypothetical protein
MTYDTNAANWTPIHKELSFGKILQNCFVALDFQSSMLSLDVERLEPDVASPSFAKNC